MHQFDLTKDSITHIVKGIAIPASIGMFFKTMYNVVDTYFAGLLSTEAQSALSISFPVFFSIIAFAAGIASAATVLIASQRGEKNLQKGNLYAQQILSFSILCGFSLTIVGLLCSPYLFSLLGATGSYLDTSLSYMNVLYVGAIFFVLNFSCNGILNAVGDTKSFRNILIIGFFLNLILSPMLMFGWLFFPEMGLTGVAVATLIIEALSALYLYKKVLEQELIGDMKLRHLIPQSSIYKDIIYQGVPNSIGMLGTGVGIFIITYFISTYGQVPVAAYGIATRIEQIFLLPMVGINIAAMSLISQNMGAGNIDRMKESIITCYKYGFGTMLVGFLIIFFFARKLMEIFSDDLAVIESGTPYLKIAAFATVAYVIHFMSDAILKGLKKPMIPLWMSMIRQIVIPLAVFSYVVKVLELDIMALWCAIIGIVVVSAIAYLVIVRRVYHKLV